jgi:hypothetical protein
MPNLAIFFGLALDIMGVASFLATGGTHFTALIPSAFGTIIFLSGVLAHIKPGIRKHAMHVAALFGLLGTLGGLGMGLPKFGALVAGTAERPAAVAMQIAMGLVSLVFVALCVKSFVDARKARPQDYGK